MYRCTREYQILLLTKRKGHLTPLLSQSTSAVLKPWLRFTSRLRRYNCIRVSNQRKAVIRPHPLRPVASTASVLSVRLDVWNQATRQHVYAHVHVHIAT